MELTENLDNKINCTTMKLMCRGIDKDGKPVLPKDSAELAILQVRPYWTKADNFPTPRMEFRNIVHCRYLAICKLHNEGLEMGDTCTVGRESRIVKSFLDQDKRLKCPYMEHKRTL